MADIGNISVGVEASYGSIDPATNLPSVAGITFRSANNTRGSAPDSVGDPAHVEVDSARADFHEEPPDPTGPVVGGTRIEHWSGDIQLSIPARLVGNGGLGIASNDDLPFAQMLASSLSDPGVDPSPASEAVSGNSGDPNSHDGASDPSDAAIGQIIAIEQGGVAEYTSVVEKAGASLAYNPALPSPVQDGHIVHFLRTLWFRAGDPLGRSIVLRYDCDGIRWAAFAARWTSVKFRTDDSGRLMADFTFRSPWIVRDNGAASPTDPVRTKAVTQKFSHSRFSLSTTETGSEANGDLVPGTLLDRTDLAVKSTSVVVTLTATLAMKADTSASPVGAELEVTDMTVSVEATVEVTELLDGDHSARRRRMLTIGFSPCGTKLGMAIIVPGAFLTTPAAARSREAGRTVQKLTWKAGRYTSDGATGGPANSIFRIGLGA